MRILVIDIDSLRPDHLGCYGYHRQTSPCIDRIAAAGSRLRNCFASDVPCCPSRSSFCQAATELLRVVSIILDHGRRRGRMSSGVC